MNCLGSRSSLLLLCLASAAIGRDTVTAAADTPSAYQSAVTVFKGLPEFKISEGGTERTPEAVSSDKRSNLAVVISRIGDRYYWASRENKSLVVIDGGGAYITYLAVDGSGYVRLIKPDAKTAAAAMGGAEGRYDYVEHLLMGLRSVTYYGVRGSF